MTYAHLVAASANNVIGKDNSMPWHLPKDLKYFKNKTWGLPVIMGRKTYESVNKPLPGRTNIVITTQADWNRDGVIKARDLDHAKEIASATDAKHGFIIGGGEIFRQTIDLVTTIYLTRVHAEIEGDVYYPEIDSKVWTLTSSQKFPVDEKHAYEFTFETWERN